MALTVFPSIGMRKKFDRDFFLFLFGIIFFFFFLGSYFWISHSLKITHQEIQRIEKELTSRRTETRILLKKEVLRYEQKIKDIAFLLSQHKKMTNLFQLVESLTHPKVQILQFHVDALAKRIDLEGKTDDFQTLSQQQILWERDPAFQEIHLGRVGLSEEGKVQFTLSILLNPKIFLESLSL